MTRRLLWLLVLLAASAACGDGDDPAPDVAAGADRSTEAPPTSGGVGLEVDVPAPLVAGAPVTWPLVVTNGTGAPVTLSFPSGQQGEVVLTAADGSEAYRWSEGMMFSQALTEAVVGARSEVTFELQGTLDVDPGVYTLEASVPSEPAPPPVRQEVIVTG